MVEPGGECIDGHALGGDRLAAGRPTGGSGDIDRWYPGMLGRWQDWRRSKRLCGGHAVIRFVAGGKRKRYRSDPDCQRYLVTHSGSLISPCYINAENRLMFLCLCYKILLIGKRGLGLPKRAWGWR
jgi:hypothetical protein